MTKVGATVAIINDRKILLTKREDYEVWCLPGGMTEPGESLAQTAIREAKEETGLTVKITRLVGVYSRLGGSDIHGALFLAEPTEGTLKPQIEEVIEIGYFAAKALPEALFWWHRQQIYDALDGVGGSAAWRMQIYPTETATDRHEIYALRDQSGLTRTEFYQYFFEQRTDDAHYEIDED